MNLTSMLHLDEYVDLLALPGVHHTVGAQCAFGAESSKPTSWVYFGVNLDDMPAKCKHPARVWFSTKDGSAVSKRHKPNTGTTEYLPAVINVAGHPVKPQQALEASKKLRNFTPPAETGHRYPSPWVTSKLAAYPDLLNRYLVSKLVEAVERCATPTVHHGSQSKRHKSVRNSVGAQQTPEEVEAIRASVPWPDANPKNADVPFEAADPQAVAKFAFSESIRWRNPTGGQADRTDKQVADAMAIGGLRNTAESVNKMHHLAQVGALLGRRMIDALMENLQKHKDSSHLSEDDAWINATCKCIGSEDARPPSEAVECVKAIIQRHTSHCAPPPRFGPPGLSELDTRLLEQWRRAAKHPDVEATTWLDDGGPAGILCAPH